MAALTVDGLCVPTTMIAKIGDDDDDDTKNDPRGAFDRILGGQRPNRHLDVKKRFGRENLTRATWP